MSVFPPNVFPPGNPTFALSPFTANTFLPAGFGQRMAAFSGDANGLLAGIMGVGPFTNNFNQALIGSFAMPAFSTNLVDFQGFGAATGNPGGVGSNQGGVATQNFGGGGLNLGGLNNLQGSAGVSNLGAVNLGGNQVQAVSIGGQQFAMVPLNMLA